METHPTDSLPAEHTGARIVAIQVGLPEARTDADGKPWTSAIGKSPVIGAVFMGRENLDGDRQFNRKHHGGPEKAVCIYSAEHYPAWRAECDRPDQPFGSFGENLTVIGLTEERTCLGDIYHAPSGAAIQICQPRVPCANVRRHWGATRLPARMRETGFTGFYCRVLAEGMLHAGDALTLAERFFPDWTVARANRALYGRAGDATRAERRALIALGPPVSAECAAFVGKLALEKT